MLTGIILNTFIMIITFIPAFLMQKFSQRAVFYGVRIPLDFDNNEELMKENKRYKKQLSLFFALVYLICIIVTILIKETYAPVIIIVGMFVDIFGIQWCYYRANKRVKEIKKKNNWGELLTQENVVMVDVKLKNRDKGKLSKWYFLPIVLLFLVTVGVCLTNWKNAEVSTLLIYFFTLVVMYISYYSINKSKQNLNGGDVYKIKLQNAKFRRSMSIFILIISYAISILFATANFSDMNLISVELQNIIIGTIITLTLVLSIILMIYSYKIGQGGRNISVDEELVAEKNGRYIINKEDDSYYIWGMFYYNPNDSALWVDKRAGVGWTINMARPFGKIFMYFIGLLLVGCLVMVIYASISMTVDLEVTSDRINIKGMYSETLKKDEIKDISFERGLPAIANKQNGGAIGNKKVGYFRTKTSEKVKLFIEDDRKPVVKIVTGEKTMYINYEDDIKTKELYEKIKK